MKKIILGLIVILAISAVNVNAQNITGGIKANANLSNFILTDMGNAESTMNMGASVGGFLKVDLGRNLAIQPELMFHFKSSRMEQTGVAEDDYQYFGVDIPVYLMGQWYTGNSNRFYVGVGPYVGLGFSAKYNDADVDLYEEVSGQSPMQRFDFGFGTQVGYEFVNGLQINAGYKIGVIDALDAGKDNATMLPQTVSLGLGYRF